MMQACFFPLTLTMILLLFFCDATVVLWYFGFLFSIAMLGAGELWPYWHTLSPLMLKLPLAAFALILLPRHSDKFFGNQPFPAELVLYAGVAALMICIIAAYIKYQVSTVNSNITQVPSHGSHRCRRCVAMLVSKCVSHVAVAACRMNA